jgi:superfamily I DNA/RNA helicase
MSGRPELVRNHFMRRFHSFEDLSAYAEHSQDAALSTRIRIALKHMDKAQGIYEAMQARRAPESEADFVATTAHKIKGREHEAVRLLDDFLSMEIVLSQARQARELFEATGHLPSFTSRVPLEEFRLIYVSVTRSFGDLAIPQIYRIEDWEIMELKNLAAGGYVELSD